jgi:hypothetical protein
VPSRAEIRQRVAVESERRSRLGVPAFAGGFLYLLSSIIISSTLNGAPMVGLVQGLRPALSGIANPAVSPRAEEVRFISHHSFGLLAGSALGAVAVGILTLVLLLLLDSTRFRRPQMWPGARPLVLFGGIAVAVVSIAHQAVSSVETHNFASGHNFDTQAVNNALTKGAANEIVDYIDLLAGLALAAGMIVTMLNSLRVGLLPRWMALLGMLSGLLIFLPIGGAELQVIVSFWMVMVGILYVGKWPNGAPPAWEAGEARPWPPSARAAARMSAAAPAAASASASDVPAPAPPAGAGSSRKRRKRGGRS